MQMSCPNCGKAVAGQDVNIQHAVAKCGACQYVFHFADHAGTRGTAKKRQVEMPESFTVAPDPMGTVITRRWRNPGVFFLLAFCLFWDGFLLVFFLQMSRSSAPTAAFLFPMIHVLVGVLLTYAAVAGIVNVTRIRIGYDAVSIHHGPLPWPGTRIVPRTQIAQVFCEERRVRTKRGYRTTYRVKFADASGGKHKLLSGLQNLDQARFIEQAMESALGLRDQHVPGEFVS